ncbi:MAG: radical SAM protein [Lachnospiraceae bacterium]|nr:radical SAM protein [Lachnospiraceae bacterium]
MDMIEKKITTKDYLTKSNLPASDYVINPYVGCPHACKYCYASFMKRFTGHREKWGSFIDIKECDKPVNIKKLQGKSIFLSSVTDCYNPLEEKYRVTRNILEQLVGAECQITISTKSNLILRDIDLLKKLSDLKVAFSVNTLDEEFRKDMDRGSTIAERIAAMKELHREGIYTVLFMSPIFPYITDCKGIIDATKDIACEYWFENLNLRGAYKQVVLDYIDTKYPSLKAEYRKIYIQKDTAYWKELGQFLQDYGEKSGINSINYFYHEKLVKEKKEKGK